MIYNRLRMPNSQQNVLEAERAEFEAVLHSRLLLRSPGVLKIADYLARKYLAGDAAQIKEYNIAVDGLGKPPDFDPKRDSIVRVEVHRLRKKIDQFYRTEGANHDLRLVIDPGQYVPRFQQVSNEEPIRVFEPPVEVEPAQPSPVPSPQLHFVRPPKPATFRPAGWLAGAAAAAAVLVAGSLFAFWRIQSGPPAPQDPINILPGASPRTLIVADNGTLWRGDRWFRGGTGIYAGPPFPMAPDDAHTGLRFGNFDYDIPLIETSWELRLHFGSRTGFEPDDPTPSDHGFDVSVNGVRIINNQDPQVGNAPAGKEIVRVFRDVRPGPDHRLHLSFRSGKSRAYVGGISLTPGEPGRLQPIRLIAKAAPWTDAQGKTWSPDGEFVSGGKLKIRPKLDPGSLDRNLLLGERYGTFSYAIPVSKGAYALKLYLSESWFGPGESGGGGIGSRRFDVYAERQPLLQDFDMFQIAGHKPLIKEFHGLMPDADGYINLNFMPRANHAAINALELTEETLSRN